MTSFTALLDKEKIDREDIIRLLSAAGAEDMRRLYDRAYEVKKKHTGTAVYLRGLIEISNICRKNCLYCGIRRGNTSVERYSMNEDEIVEAALLAHEWGYGSIVIQSGERNGGDFTTFIEVIIRKINAQTSNGLGITLSLGEQSAETYLRWYQAGAHRYLLRIETSDRDLYRTLHPFDHSYERRIECLSTLKEIGYQTGTGVMIGLPGQTIEHLAGDIEFFLDIDADMIGMGPYIPHHDTPLGKSFPDSGIENGARLDLSLKMIAATRIALKDVNIASTTALQAIHDQGREMGILVGANVVMPNITPARYRRDYQLYDNKPCLDEYPSQCSVCIENRIKQIGETVGYHERGDSPHFFRRMKRSSEKKHNGTFNESL